jgi:hypothetical protein
METAITTAKAAALPLLQASLSRPPKPPLPQATVRTAQQQQQQRQQRRRRRVNSACAKAKAPYWRQCKNRECMGGKWGTKWRKEDTESLSSSSNDNKRSRFFQVRFVADTFFESGE